MAASLRFAYAAPLLDMSGYAAMARAVVLGLDALGVEVAAQSLWHAGVPQLTRVPTLEPRVQVALRPLAGGLWAAFEADPADGQHTIYLRAPDGSCFAYRTSVAARDAERLLALAARPPAPGSIYAIHMLPALGATDFYATARAGSPGHAWYIGSTMFETAGIPPGWARACNGMDEIWVPSRFNRETFRVGGVDPDKIRVLPLGIDTTAWDPARVRPLAIPNQRGFSFLSVFQWTKRKGWDVLLRAYLAAFRPEDDVTLVLRAYYGGGESVGERLARWIIDLGHDPAHIPDIVMLDHQIPDALMPALYASCDAYVLPSRGEGWGMPYLEAMAMAKPVIGTRWSGNLEFMSDENSFLVDVDGIGSVDDEQALDNPLYAGQQWAEPSVTHTAALLRRVFEDRAEGARRAARARADVLAEWTVARQAGRLRARLKEIAGALTRRPAARPERRPPLRVLLQNRPGAETYPGGDTVVVERYRQALAARGAALDVVSGRARTGDYDVLHLFNFATPEFTEHCAREAVRAGVPFVVTTLYEDWPCFLRQSAAAFALVRDYVTTHHDAARLHAELATLRQLPTVPRPANPFTAAQAARLLACSEGERTRLREDYPGARIEVLPFGADHLTLDDVGPEPFVRATGFSDFVLCVGRLETRKNQLMLLAALEHEDVPLVFLTGGFTYQPEYAALCRRFARRAPILFLDRLPAEMLASAYRAARLLCVPSWFELPGLVALEAARTGCPVAASSWGELPEYLGDAVEWCTPDDPVSIRRAVLEAAAHPAPPALAARAGALRWDDAVDTLLRLYEGLAGERTAVAASAEIG